MKATNTAYNFSDSLSRIDEILNAPNTNYEEKKSIPTTGLTYNNGYYVNCTAIFVDICDSSDMTDVQKRPVLAKIYRSFISEMVAMFNGLKIIILKIKIVYGIQFQLCFNKSQGIC